MGWDGSGGYDRQRNFSADASAGIRILASAMDQEVNDIASAMQNCLARDGQNTPTADIPLGGNRLVNGGQPASATDYIRAKEVIENVPIFMQDEAASAGAISVSSQFFTGVSATQAPADGVEIKVRMLFDKATCALYLDGFSANVLFNDGTGADNAFLSGGIYDFIYSSAESSWRAMNHDFPSTQTKFKTANEVRNSDTVISDDGHLVGYTLRAGTYYEIEGLLQAASPADADIDCALTFTNAPQEFGIQINGSNADGTVTSLSGTATAGGEVKIEAQNNNRGHYIIRGFILTNATTGGTVDFQWAQNASNATNSLIYRGSWLRLNKLS